jgi:hypothetical protein
VDLPALVVNQAGQVVQQLRIGFANRFDQI